jgi:hypothetical protein
MQPISITRLSRMSAQQVRQYLDGEAPHGPRDERPLPEFSASEQFAIVSKGRTALCRKVASLLWKSTVNRPQAKDFRLLEDLGLLIQPAPFKHEASERGLRVAHNTALQIAKDLGLHEIVQIRRTYHFVSVICTCGHAAMASQIERDAAFRAERKHLQHLHDIASGKWNMLIRLTHADASARTIGIPEQSRSAPVEDRMSIEMISVFEQMYSPPECRWAACWGTYDTGSVCGLGPTPEAAKADLIENYDRPAPFGSDEAEILAAIAQQYRGDHNIETLFVILTRVAFERLQLLQALKELVEASGSMAPAGGEARYETAVERAEAAISKVRI